MLQFAVVPFFLLLQSTVGFDYSVMTTTGNDLLAGTDSTVLIKIGGTNGWTGEHELDSGGNDFEKGSTDSFRFTDSKDVGYTSRIQIRRTSFPFGDWKLEKVMVQYNGNVYSFKYNKWLPKNKWVTIDVSCPSGYRKNSQNICEDIDECRENPNACNDAHAQCANRPGSFSCKCNPGYDKRGSRCEDINECNSHHGCQHDCENFGGSYRCTCRSGYRPRAKFYCDNINECKETSPCVSPATCTDTAGSYECTCPSGFHKVDRHNCKDTNECLKSDNKCDFRVSDCVNLPGNYKCQCKFGFKQTSTYQCSDINECTEGKNICDLSKSTCKNLVGSFYCMCKQGYHQGKNNKICEADVCGPLSTPFGGVVEPARCLQTNANDFGNRCSVRCNNGYELEDSSAHTLTCGLQGRWQGKRPQCTGVKCPALSAIDNGSLLPAMCGTTGAKYTGVCSYICRNGYQMSGSPQRKCQADKTWTGSKPSCIKVVARPWIRCPFDIIVDLQPGQSTADVSAKWKNPSSNTAPITVIPSTATANYRYPAGETKITWTVSNAAGLARCSILVIVNDKEKPKITSCPADPIRKLTTTNSASVTWSQPKFTDNVGVVRVSSTHQSGHVFSLGTFNVFYVAYDAARNRVECSFSVVVLRQGCADLPGPHGGAKACNKFGQTQFCTVKCPAGQVVYKNPSMYAFWSCSAGKWTPTPMIPDCVAAKEISDGQSCSENRALIAIKNAVGTKKYCVACPTGTFFSNSACVSCAAGRYQDQQGMTACKACPSGTSSLAGASNVTQCRVICRLGHYSKSGLEPGCQVCSSDSYQDQSQSTACKPCPKGTTTISTGSTKLSDCGTKPAISRVSPVNNTIDEGETVSMSCFVSGKPRPTINWKFRKTINPAFLGKKTLDVIKNPSGAVIGLKLTITKATYENTGVYECHVENSWGKVMASSVLNVNKVFGSGGGAGFDEAEDLDMMPL